MPLTFAASTVSQACQITMDGSLETSSDAIPVEIGMHNIHLLCFTVPSHVLCVYAMGTTPSDVFSICVRVIVVPLLSA